MQTRPVPVAGLAVALVCTVLVAACAGAPAVRVLPETSTAPLPAHAPAPHLAPKPQAACADCGRVVRIEVVSGIRATASGGAVLGGVVGGVLSAPAPARPASAPTSRGPIPTASAAAPRPAQRAWRVHLHMDDGRTLVVHQNLLSREVVAGSRVRLVQGRLVPLH